MMNRAGRGRARLLLAGVLGLMVAAAGAQQGAAVYQAHCASCHSSGTAHVPPESALRAMSAAQVEAALTTGPMQTVGAGLTAAERSAVASYLGTATATAVAATTGFCRTPPPALTPAPHGARWSGWSPDATNARYQDAAGAGLTAAQVPRLKLKWAFSLGAETEARSQPAVWDGRMFFGTGSGEVYSLDARSGCIIWKTKVANGLRSAVTVGAAGGAAPLAVYFGAGADMYALDAASGKLRWKTKVAQHPAAMITAAPLLHQVLHQGTLYVSVSSFEEAIGAAPTYPCCSFRGSVVALDAATGRQLWKSYTIPAPHPTVKSKAGVQMQGPSGGAVWSTVTYDGKLNVVYAATGDNYSLPATATSDAVLAFDARSGKQLWSRQLTSGDVFNDGCAVPGNVTCPHPAGHDSDFGEPPILVALPHGRRALVLGEKSGVAYALDPDHGGALLWQRRAGKGGALGGIQWGSASDGRRLYVANSDLVIQGIVPRKSPAQGYQMVLNTRQGGGLLALDLSSGQVDWSAAPINDCGARAECSPAQSQAVSAIPGVVFSGSDDGHLRAYSASDGKVIWDMDTVRAYPTINGAVAHGGSLDGPGPVIAGGMVYVSSGYGEWGGTPGNVLLAYSVDGR